jgi:hypothetical protein
VAQSVMWVEVLSRFLGWGPSVSFFLEVDALSAPGRDGRRNHGTGFRGSPGRVSGRAWRRCDGVGATPGEPQAPSETGLSNERAPHPPLLLPPTGNARKPTKALGLLLLETLVCVRRSTLCGWQWSEASG